MGPARAVLADPSAPQRRLGWAGRRRWLLAFWLGSAHRLRFWQISRLLASIEESERGRFALWLPVFMGVGVLAYYALRTEPPPWIGAKFAFAGFTAAMALPRWPVLRAIGLAVGFTALGFASAQYATDHRPPLETGLPARAMLATGTVRAVEILSYARRITLSGVELNDVPQPPARTARGQPVRNRQTVGREPASQRSPGGSLNEAAGNGIAPLDAADIDTASGEAPLGRPS